jgi:hypothetical protein
VLGTKLRRVLPARTPFRTMSRIGIEPGIARLSGPLCRPTQIRVTAARRNLL